MARFSRRVVVAVLGALSLLAPAPRAVATAKTIPPPPAGFANLSVKDLQLAQSNITAGSRVAAKVTVSNEGTSNATPTTLKMWFSHSASGSMLDAKADLLSGVPLGIAPRRTVTYDATVTAPKGPQPGTYRIFAYVATTATEYTLANTKRAATLVLSGPSAPAGPPPDPTPAPAPVPKADIMPSSLKLGTATIAAGGTTPVQLTVANRGTAPAGSVGVTISLVSGATTSRAASLNIGTLAAGASGTVVTMLTAPNLAGTYTVLAAATTPDPETSTANNTVTMTLTVTVSGAPTPAPQGTSCDHYASPTGTGNGASASAPFRIADFWDFALPGKTLCLLDGTYREPDSMIAPAPGLSGASQHPITIRALNDGAVTIDGKFQRPPVKLRGNNWWVLEGFNAKNGDAQAVVFYTAGSNDNIMRRVVAWDARIDANNDVIGVHGSARNLFEDVAAFGTARKVFSGSQGGSNLTCRRCWIRWEGSLWGGPIGATMIYNQTNVTFENVLVTWSGESMPTVYTVPNSSVTVTNGEPQKSTGILSVDRIDTTPPKHANLALRGSIVYLMSNAKLPPGGVGGMQGGKFPRLAVYGLSSVTLTDVVSVMSPAHSRFNDLYGFQLQRTPQNGPTKGQSTNDPVVNNTATRLTSIRGNRGDFAHADWTVMNTSVGPSLDAVQSPWQNNSTNGARLCYRWGRTTPLWPWPMNERIKAATAAAGRYSGPCPTCVGGRAPRTATDVTADIKKLLGPIPAACRR